MWHLSAAELDGLWELLGLGEPPYPLALPSPGVSRDERVALLADLRTTLTERGLLVADRIDERLAIALRVVAGSGAVIEAQVSADRHMRVRAACDDGTAGMVVQIDDRARVHWLAPARWHEAVMELLPPLPPAAGQSITVPAEELREGLRLLADGSGRSAFEDELRRAGVGGVEARWVIGLATARQMIGVQLTVSAPGTPDAAPARETISWYGTPDGAAMLLGVADGSAWVSIVPASRDKLSARLAQAVEQTR